MNDFQILVDLLKEKGLKISCAESCTGGMFASGIVSISDASKVLEQSFVTYSDNSKIDLVSVKKETIAQYGVVSEITALEMARGAAEKASADVGLGITGFAGPKSSPEDDTAGTVCFGFYVNGKTMTSTKQFGDVGRNVVRELYVIYACNTLIRLIRSFG